MPSPDPADILLEALNAVPPIGQTGKWAPLLPAIEILLARRFSLTDAIEWLVARNAIRAEDRRCAYYSISQRFRRAGAPVPRKGPVREPVNTGSWD